MTGKCKARKDSNTVSNKFTTKMFVDYQLEMFMTGKLNEKKITYIVASKFSNKITNKVTSKLNKKVTYIVTNKVFIKMFVRSISWKCLRQVNLMKKVTNKVTNKFTKRVTNKFS
jgi:hypothetical protein